MNASQEQHSVCDHVADERSCPGEAPRLDDLPNGHHIGDYVVEKKLGSGGMATVYAVRNGKFALESKLFALKIFTCGDGNCNELRRKFVNEAEILHAEKLGHKYLVKVHDLQRNGSHPYYVMDLVQGSDGNVSSLDKVRCDQKRLRKWFGQVCEVLAFIHSKNLIHRDIKPSNVLIDENDDIRLTDFGVAKILDEELRSKLLNGRTMVTGMSQDTPPVFGTRDYLPPEVLDDTEATPAWDIWATGKMFFEKLTGGTCDYSSTERFIVDSLRAVDESGFWVAQLPKFLAPDPSVRTPDLLECARCALDVASSPRPGQGKLAKRLAVGSLATIGVVLLALFLHNSKQPTENDSRSNEFPHTGELGAQAVQGIEEAQQGKDVATETSHGQGSDRLQIGNLSADNLFAAIPNLRDMLALYPTCQWAHVEADVSPTDEWFTKVGLYVKTGVCINYDKFEKEYLPRLEDALLALSGETPIKDSAVSVFQELDLQKRRRINEIFEKRSHSLSSDIDIKGARGWWTHQQYPIIELAGMPYLFVGNPKANWWQQECPEFNPIMLQDLDRSATDYDFSNGSTVVLVCSWAYHSMEPLDANIKKFTLGREPSIRFYNWAQKSVDVSGSFIYKLTRDASNDHRGAKYTKVPMKYLANIKIGVSPDGPVFYVDALVGATGAWAMFADRLPNSWVDDDFEKRFDRVVHAAISDGAYKDFAPEPELSVPRHNDSNEPDPEEDIAKTDNDEVPARQDTGQDAGDLNIGKHFVVRCLAKNPRTVLSFSAGRSTRHEMEYQYDLSIDADWYFKKLMPVITNIVFETSKCRPEISRIEIPKPFGGTGISYDSVATEPVYANQINWQILGLKRTGPLATLSRDVPSGRKNKNAAQVAVVISQTGESKMAREIACAIYSMSSDQFKKVSENLSAFEVKEPKVSYDVMLDGQLIEQKDIPLGDLDLSSHSEDVNAEHGDVYVFTPWFCGGWIESIQFPISVKLRKYSHNSIEIKFHGAESRN